MASQVAGVAFPELVHTRVFEPAGLTQTYLRLPAELHPMVARVAGATGAGADWAIFSSLYGSQLGHPSYGVTATLPDLLRFLLLFDPYGDRKVHSPAGLQVMTTDATSGFRSKSEGYPIAKWGAGFMLHEGSGNAGIASLQSYGHLGGTGCVGWVDPRHGVSIAFVSNSHADLGMDEWTTRMEEAVNVAIAAATAPR
jgi:CubicO group peptidase (beta-lactamase class C family)